MTPQPSWSADQPAPSRGEPRELTLAVGAPAHGGHCVARPVDDPGGRVIFVRHALPGETVRARLTEMTSRTWRADAVEILQASPDRVESVWPEAGPAGVGGGELAHVALDAQRTWKRWVLADCLRRIGGQEVADAVASLPEASAAAAVPIEPMPTDAAAQASTSARRRALAGTATRTRISLTVSEDGRPGMHAFRSGTVLPLHRLPLAVPAITEIGLLERSRWRAHYRPGMRIEAIAPSGGEPVVLIGEDTYAADGVRIDADVLRWNVPVGSGVESYYVRPSGFWQTHVRGAEVLANAVLAAAFGSNEAGAGRAVMELYSGAGLFSVPLARAVGETGRMVTLEGDEAAVRDAGENLEAFDWVDAFAGNVDREGLIDLSGQLGAVPDVVVADPPRAGAGATVCEAIAATGAPRVVLVSCDPAAGARDLRTLTEAGYQLESLQAWDLFPHTHHVETVSVLSR